MDQMRVKDHGVYHRMTEFQKACYGLGLPHRYMGHKVMDLVFADYAYDTTPPKHIPAQKQKRWAASTKKNFGRNQEINGIVAFYSSPTDEAAFRCAASMFEGAVKGGLSCRAVSATTVRQEFRKIPVADLYLIHGITDIPNPETSWAVRDFLRERDGSMRFVVMSGEGQRGPWKIIHEILRMQFDIILCLKDADNRSSGSLEQM